jgi:hypothetical protein
MTKKCDTSPPGLGQTHQDLVQRHAPRTTPLAFGEARPLPDGFIALLHQAERWGTSQDRFTSEANPWAMFSLLVFYACGLSQGKTELSHMAVQSGSYEILCDVTLALWQSGAYLPDPSAFPYHLEQVIEARRAEKEAAGEEKA